MALDRMREHLLLSARGSNPFATLPFSGHGLHGSGWEDLGATHRSLRELGLNNKKGDRRSPALELPVLTDTGRLPPISATGSWHHIFIICKAGPWRAWQAADSPRELGRSAIHKKEALSRRQRPVESISPPPHRRRRAVGRPPAWAGPSPVYIFPDWPDAPAGRHSRAAARHSGG